MRHENDFVKSSTKPRTPVYAQPAKFEFLQEVYREKIGQRLLFWRIAPRKYFGPVLEWFVYDKTDRRAATLRRETDVRKVASMEKLQRPQRKAELDDIPDGLVEQLVDWHWAQVR